MRTNFLIFTLCIVAILSVTASGIQKERENKLGVVNPDFVNQNAVHRDEWFTQKLDHFDPTSTVTWLQRYGTNDSFYKQGTDFPVFLMIYGEDILDKDFLHKQAWITYAAMYGALCFLLEHRYYGKSRPTEDLSLKNLKYLNSQQALADSAYFIEGMKEKYGLSNANKWIAFGGSYAGCLAAWLRLKYPHLLYAAVSSSAPLLAKVNFFEYYQIVEKSFATYSKDCVESIKNATETIKVLLKTVDGREKLKKAFDFCESINTTNNDVAVLFGKLSTRIGLRAQAKDNRFFGISKICSTMMNTALGTPLVRYSVIHNDISSGRCLKTTYRDKMKYYNRTNWINEDRQWLYQTCTEFGYFETSENPDSMFGDNIQLKYFQDQCKDLFGISPVVLESAINRTNMIYGGLDIKVNRVVFIHGSFDPWHALGLTNSTNPESPSIYINATHDANMVQSSPKDSPELVKARQQISELIGYWLGKVHKQ